MSRPDGYLRPSIYKKHIPNSQLYPRNLYFINKMEDIVVFLA